MKALVKEGVNVAVAQVPRPRPAADEVLIQVALAGVCRTDVYVAEGLIPCRDPLILGHELAGVVTETGSRGTGLQEGDLVTVAPLLRCGGCGACAAGRDCTAPRMLGVHHDGAFAEYVCVPAANVHRAPAGLPLPAVAYTEPVAAAMAVLRAGLRPGERGLIYGRSRIALLVQRVLAAAGLGEIPLYDPSGSQTLPEAEYDYIIETVATTRSLAEMLPAVRTGGRIVLKSRPPQPAELPITLAVLREVSLISVAYGSFPEALSWLSAGRLYVDDLLGKVHPLADFGKVFSDSQSPSSRKEFLAPSAADP